MTDDDTKNPIEPKPFKPGKPGNPGGRMKSRPEPVDGKFEADDAIWCEIEDSNEADRAPNFHLDITVAADGSARYMVASFDQAKLTVVSREVFRDLLALYTAAQLHELRLSIDGALDMSEGTLADAIWRMANHIGN